MKFATRPATQSGALLVKQLLGSKSFAARASYGSAAKPWTCAQCRQKLEVKRPGLQDQIAFKRHFSQSLRLRDDNTPASRTSVESTQAIQAETPASSSSSLPSHTAKQRSQLSNRVSTIVDQILARASIASQHINAYTGTDYSGIEALRNEILEQEQKVRTYHAAVDKAREQHHEAHAKQTSAQREIVGLLERKSSWSPTDLERYMSLVRSEHMNDMDVQQAKDNLAEAERSLEDARSLLERLERKQYHEEQVWSDTIRRNSTWVTFGLMGVNILLLLAQIAIFEPYRRKKIVKDVKAALDEKTLPSVPAVQEVVDSMNSATTAQDDIAEVDKDGNNISLGPSEDVAKMPLSAGEMLPSEASDFVAAIPLPKEQAKAATPSRSAPDSAVEFYQEALRDLFSERIVQLRKVDVTNIALQGAATGVAVMGLLFVLLRPR